MVFLSQMVALCIFQLSMAAKLQHHVILALRAALAAMGETVETQCSATNSLMAVTVGALVGVGACLAVWVFGHLQHPAPPPTINITVRQNQEHGELIAELKTVLAKRPRAE